jgi:predicted CXXCH cytochrome family protein
MMAGAAAGRFRWVLPAAMLAGCALLGSAAGVSPKGPGRAAAVGEAAPAKAAPPSKEKAVATVSPAPKDAAAAKDAVVRKTVFPPHRAIVLSGSFDVIAEAGPAALAVNGKPQGWEAFEPPLRVAHLHLSSGKNEIQVGDQRLDLFFARYPGDEDSPKGWPTCRWHPISKLAGTRRCDACHKTQEQGTKISVGEFQGHTSCLVCHSAAKFKAIHSHPLKPLESCQTCHAIHGSTEKALLKAPAKKLCAKCHKP